MSSARKYVSKEADGLIRGIKCSGNASDGSSKKIAAIETAAKTWCKLLARIEKAPNNKRAYLCEMALKSQRGRELAVARILTRRGKKFSISYLQKSAKRIAMGEHLQEQVLLEWRVFGTKPRLMGKLRLLRAASQLMIRDILEAAGVEGSIDFNKRNGGGVKALLGGICGFAINDFRYWAAPDVSNCFLSLRREHLQGMPIGDGTIQNEAFLNAEADTHVKFKEEDRNLIAKAMTEWGYPCIAENNDIRKCTTQIACQGLLPGTFLANTLARIFLNRALMKLADEEEIVVGVYGDNIVIGARIKGAVISAVKKLETEFSALPGAAIRLHNTKSNRLGRIEILGYKFQPGRGFDDNLIHVLPGKQTIERFKRRLKIRLLIAANSNANPFAVAEAYWEPWFGSLAGWTKVPHHSKNVSLTITYSYVDDFLDGLEMGTWFANQPKKPLTAGQKKGQKKHV